MCFSAHEMSSKRSKLPPTLSSVRREVHRSVPDSKSESKSEMKSEMTASHDGVSVRPTGQYLPDEVLGCDLIGKKVLLSATDCIMKHIYLEIQLTSRNYTPIPIPDAPFMGSFRDQIMLVCEDRHNIQYNIPYQLALRNKGLRHHIDNRDSDDDGSNDNDNVSHGIPHGLVVYLYMNKGKSSIHVDVPLLRKLVSPAKKYNLSRIIIISDVPIVSVNEKRIKTEEEFNMLEWEFRKSDTFKYHPGDLNCNSFLERISFKEAAKESLRDNTLPSGWNNIPENCPTVISHGLKAGTMVRVISKTSATPSVALIVPSDPSIPVFVPALFMPVKAK